MQPNASNGSTRTDPGTDRTSPQWGYHRASSSTKSSNNKLIQCNLMLQIVVAVLTHVPTVGVLSGDTTVVHHPLVIKLKINSMQPNASNGSSPQWGYPRASSSTKSSNNKLTQCNPMLQMVVAVLTPVGTARVLSGDTPVLHHPLNHQIIN